MIKNVIIVSEVAYCGGGASQVALLNANLLVNKGLKVYYCCKKCEENGQGLSSEIEIIEFNVVKQNCEKNLVKGFVNKLYNRVFKKNFSLFLKKFNTEDTIVHLHNWSIFSYSIFSALKDWGGKYCLTMHDYYSICPNSSFYNYKTRNCCANKPLTLNCIFCSCDRRSYFHKVNQVVRLAWQSLLFKYAFTNVIYVSEFSKKIFESNFLHTKNSIVIDNAIEDFALSDIDIEEKDYFLFVGRLVPEKGCELFCQAISDLDIEGIVVGMGEEYNNLVKKFPKVKFVGWKEKKVIGAYMKNARALVFPSRLYETAGLSVIEGLMCNLPIILSSDIAACSYVQDGITGIYFKRGNLNSLKESMIKLNDKTIAERMKKNIQENYDFSKFKTDAFISKHLEFYQKIL